VFGLAGVSHYLAARRRQRAGRQSLRRRVVQDALDGVAQTGVEFFQWKPTVVVCSFGNHYSLSTMLSAKTFDSLALARLKAVPAAE
jgi:hypothetical protein